MKKNALMVLPESAPWSAAGAMGYAETYAFQDGLTENGHRCTILPAFRDGALLARAPSLFQGETFDQAWVWCGTEGYGPGFWAWLETVAPVRIGLVRGQGPGLEQLGHCTHALVADPREVAAVRTRFGIPALWNAGMVPERFVRFDDPPEGPGGIPEQPALPPSEALHGEGAGRDELERMTASLKALREQAFGAALEALHRSGASVLPASLHPSGLPAVVAAGAPVLAGGDAHGLFREPAEILCFDGPGQLRAQRERLAADPELRAAMTTAARNTLLVRHTSRIRLRQYEQWLDHGLEPDFAADIGYKPSVEESRYYRRFFTEGKWSRPTPNDDEQARWVKIRLFLAAARAAQAEPLDIVEIGSGRGWLANLCGQFGTITGIEPVGDVAARGRTLFPGLRLLTGSAELLTFLGHAGRYDALVCSEVIEHVPYAAKAEFIRTLVALVRPGGHLILTTPRMDIYPEWSERWGLPPQPTEDWLTEAGLRAGFEAAGCAALRLERAHLLDIYQVWLFRKHSPHPLAPAGDAP